MTTHATQMRCAAPACESTGQYAKAPRQFAGSSAVLLQVKLMCSSTVAARAARSFAAALCVSGLMAACQNDQISGVPIGCAAIAGCEPISPVAAPEALAALKDISSRIVGTLNASSRASLATPLARFERGVITRDVADGEAALQSIYTIIALGERTHAEDLPDLSALRLALVPSVRSLGLTPLVSPNQSN